MKDIMSQAGQKAIPGILKGIDLARLVVMLCYEGKDVGKIAKEFRTTKKKVLEVLEDSRVSTMILKAQTSRLKLMAHVPIANFATRMKRREGLYKQFKEVDPDFARKLLNDAGMEMKGLEDEWKEREAPKVQVNIEHYHTSSEDKAAMKDLQDIVEGEFVVKEEGEISNG